IEGRSDDTLKIAGKRVGPAEVESAAVAHPAVSEAAAVGVPHEIKGEGIVVFCVLRPGREGSSALEGEIQDKIAELLGKPLRPEERGRDALVVDAKPRIGDTWRERWSSLRLFTPRFMNTLPGLRFPDGADPFPGKEEVADYQERYASERGLDVRMSTRVTRLR